MFEIGLRERRKGDFVALRYYPDKYHVIREPYYNDYRCSIEVDLGDVINEDQVDKILRRYTPGDWMSPDA